MTGVVPQPRPSSPKYAKPLVEVPQTIEVIPRVVMDAQGVTTLSDALRNVPGISLQAGEGRGASNTSGDTCAASAPTTASLSTACGMTA